MLQKDLSFAMKVKNEVFYNKQYRAKNKLAQGYGLIMFSKHFNKNDISIITENKGVARLYCDLIYDLSPISGTITLTETRNSGSTITYTAYVDDSNDKLTILNTFKNDDAHIINFDLLKNELDLEAFLSGVYLACGNVSDPLKGYHLEFVINNQELCTSLSDLLFMLRVKHGIMQRRGQYVVYMKESEQIENVLAMIGATKTAYELMDIKIYKEFRNKVNRQTNCETANIDKTVKAATKQTMAIEHIRTSIGLDSLPSDLKELALLRVENPDMSLRELGENHSQKLSRSAVNHRLEKIITLAETAL
ncbi:MAG: DNA-binding protein WhiA [Oscillospiraceae bacterium]